MPAREIIELRGLIEAELDIHGRHREFRGVDNAAFQCRVDIRSGKQLRLHAHLRHDLGAQTEETHLQALDLLQRRDFSLEPAGGFGADREAVERNQIMLVIDFVAKLLASAEPFPGDVFADPRTERNGCEERQCRVFGCMVAGCRPAGIDRALGSRIEAFE